MRTIRNGYFAAETFTMPTENVDGVLHYISEYADDLIIKAYGEHYDKYKLDINTLELFYLVSDKMRFKIGEITYESYFTDIRCRDGEKDWVMNWLDNDYPGKPEDYEAYNLTVYLYDKPQLKSLIRKFDVEDFLSE